MFFSILFWIALILLYYLYDGYLRLLQVTAFFFGKKNHTLVPQVSLPSVTVLITVYNEAAHISDKLKNVLESDYPQSLLKVLVASDGSTDRTDEIVNALDDSRVRLFRPEERKGKTDTQNQAIALIDSDIIVFTDADTRFDGKFLRQLVIPFEDAEVGCVDGHLLFLREDNSLSQSQGFYWNYELMLRSLESQLGILAVASGASLAVRRQNYRPMEAAYGEDCIIPLDVVLQGKRVVHAGNAVAYDQMPSSTQSEFRTRVRMTLRNWQGTWSRPAILNPLVHPGYAFALWSHKILRWLSPLFLILLTVSVLGVALLGSFLFAGVSLGLLLFYGAGFVGFFLEKKGKKFPLIGTVYSFQLANLGFMVGVWRALKGEKVTTYR